MIRNLIAGLAVSAAIAAPAARAADLEPGKPAPTLDHVKWLKGEPIKQWEKGQVYVLDFWATWCGPCVASIPHVNQLQKEYADKGVHVIGVAIWPNDRMTPTKEFVDKKGDDMAYTVAEDVDGAEAAAFMAAAGQNGIPTAFVIDKSGKVAWIGHPMQGLDEVVDLVVKDKYSVAEVQKKEEQIQKLVGKLRDAYYASKWDDVAKIADEMLAFDQKKLSAAAVYKYLALVKLDDGNETPSKARVWGTHVISTLYADDADSLNALAWHIVGPQSELSGDEVDSEFAVMVAEKAAKLTNNEDINVLDTLARAYFVNGDTQKAGQTEDTAIGIIDQKIQQAAAHPDTVAQLQGVKEQLQSRKDEYTKPTATSDGG